MSDKINKSSLKEAKASFEEIQKFAIEEATKNLQEDVSKKVVEIMNNSLEENTSSDEEKEVVQEEVTINADGTTITVDDNGDVVVDAEGSLESDEVEIAEEPIEMDSEEIVVDDSEDEIEIDNSEIDEMNLEEMNFEEQEEMAAAPEVAPAPEAAPAEMPVEEPVEEMPIEEEPAMANPFEAISDKLDTLIGMMGGESAAGGEEVEIIDDTAAEAPAPAEAPVAEEITFEVVNDMQVPEMEIEDEVLEIVGEMEEEEETMDEVKMMGQSHSVQKSTGTSAGPSKAKEERERLALKENEDKNKAQYEAKIAELIKENESLKEKGEKMEQELIKFENSFIKLQENFGEMQDYNAKLVMAYKVAMSGGLTTDEKIQISEQFDNCETVEDAEKLYKSIVNEHKIKVNKNPEKSIKSTSIKSSNPAKSESKPLYESREVKRMKELAGIKKNEL